MASRSRSPSVARDRRCGRIINGVSYLVLGVFLLAVGFGALVAVMAPQVRTPPGSGVCHCEWGRK